MLAARARFLMEQSKALEVAARIVTGEECEPRVVDKEVLDLPPMNRDKLGAIETLAKIGDVIPRAGVNIAATGPVTINVVRIKKAVAHE
jgi:hypothetical protein